MPETQALCNYCEYARWGKSDRHVPFVRTGMRRPSWNKSQAIQQVISLKSLLETTDGSGAGVLRKISVSKENENPPPVSVVSSTLSLVAEKMMENCF